MASDRITELRIEGLRSIDTLTLKLRGLSVLIGDNGTGKSAIVEACELLRRASTEGFFRDFQQTHGGLPSLLRIGSSKLTLSVRVEGKDAPLEYRLSLGNDGRYAAILEETLDVGPWGDNPRPFRPIDRGARGARIFGVVDEGKKPELQRVEIGPDDLALVVAPSLLSPHPAIRRMRAALANMEVHLPFEVAASWVARAEGRRSDARADMQLQPVTRLERLGKNLPNVYYALQNEFGAAHWNETLDYVRLGLGYELETITLRASASGGAHSLWLKMRGQDEQISAASISDGMLAYLAFVALYRLPRQERSLLTFDEPDLHLHPELLVRVVKFFEDIAEEQPVLLTTHSDRLLDALASPEMAVQVCELEQPGRATRLRRLDAAMLARWLERYRGVGDLRGSGYLPHVLAEQAEESSS